MGMYDEVMIACPHCGHMNTEQSKSGECALETYLLREAPLGVLGGLGDYSNGTMWCEECKQPYHIIVSGIGLMQGEKDEDN